MTNAPKECHICHYWHFKDIGFKYEPYLSNGCHDLMEKAMNFNDVATLSIKGSDYRIHLLYTNKYDAGSIINNSNLDEESGLL